MAESDLKIITTLTALRSEIYPSIGNLRSVPRGGGRVATQPWHCSRAAWEQLEGFKDEYPHLRPDSGCGLENLPTPIEREFRQTQTMKNSPLRKSCVRPTNPQPQLSSSASVELRVYYEVAILGLVY
jgi:hypothetical protein